MKLRLRSMDAGGGGGGGGGETHRVQLPDTAALSDVKAFLAAKLSAAQPVPAESVRLSLNRSEELISPDPSANLPALGLASGDLLYFTLSPFPSHPPPPQTIPRSPNPDALSIPKVVGCSESPMEAGRSSPPPQTLHTEVVSSLLPRTLHVEPSLPAASDPPDVMMAKAFKATKGSSSFVIWVLKRQMEAENAGGAEGTVVHRLVVALHAALLDAGFLAVNPLGFCLRLPQDQSWGASATPTMKYTLPEIAAMLPEAEGKVAILNYSLMANYVMVYGCVPGAQSEVRRLCLELPKLAPLLYLDSDEMGGVEEREILELWRVLKDELCLPLIVSLCQLNGLRLPPCLMALPGDLKAKVLEFVPGVDLARVECTCKELRYLAADDNLWKRKCELELKACGEGSRGSRNWKKRFGAAWAVKVFASKKRLKNPSPRFWNYGWGNNPHPHSPLGSPVIGGDSDRLPFIVNHSFLGHFGNQ